MLEDIIISRVRVKILTLFLSHPGVMYHVRDIVRKVDEEINAVRRELSHMEKAGMVSKEQRANRLFYLFRKDYPLYFELMELVCKTSGIGADVIRQKAKLGKLKYVVVSGKYVRGISKKSQSEVDLVVVGNVVLPELSQVIKAEEARHEKEINYTVMTEEEFVFRKSRRDPFVISVLTGSRVMIVGDEEDFVS
jgi:hypothetical protein